MSKKIVRYVLAAVAAVVLAFTPLFVFSKLPISLNTRRTVGYQGILTVWNIDTFEGGATSRTRWLNLRGAEYQKLNKSTYIMCVSYSIDQMLEQLSAGHKPDMFSFGIGAGEHIIGLLAPYTRAVNVRHDLADGGTVDGKLLGVPYCYGGYMLIGNSALLPQNSMQADDLADVAFSSGYAKKGSNVYSLITGGSYNLPLVPLINQTSHNADGQYSVYPDTNALTQYGAYEKYVSQNAAILLGTQRDLFRCDAKYQNGAMKEQRVRYLSDYTDIVQYIGVVNGNTERTEAAMAFAEYLVSDVCQKKVVQLNLLAASGISIYSSGVFGDFEKAMRNNLKVLNVFSAQYVVQGYKENCYKAISGDQTAKNLVKNLF